ANIDVAHDLCLHDLLWNSNAREYASIYCSDATPTHYVYNNVLWEPDGICFRGLINADSLIENNAAYIATGTNSGEGDGFNAVNRGGAYRNNTSYDNARNDFGLIGVATGTNNRSSDITAADVNWAVGVGNTINAVVAADVQGVNDALANFFDITAGGPLDGAGVANGIAERLLCIRNRAVPGPNGTSVGPAEIVTPSAVVAGVARTQSHIAQAGGISIAIY
ncbi:unnamed protein product, partial [marine sediment metagenome]